MSDLMQALSLNVLLFCGLLFLADLLFNFKKKISKQKPKQTNNYLPMKFVALVAACNEEKGIEIAIRSLYTQKEIQKTFVVLNNTTDSTPIILANLKKEMGDWLVVLNMENNPYLKAGALNYGFVELNKQIGHLSDDYVILTLDADTIVGDVICHSLLEAFSLNSHAGGVNIPCKLQDFKLITNNETPTLMQSIWYAFQDIEYKLSLPIKYSQQPDVRILSGACSAFRLCALKQIFEAYGFVWHQDTIVEDFKLARELREFGWETPNSTGVAYTDAPIDMKTLYKQRKRWYKGAVVLLWEDLMKKFNLPDAWHLFQILITPIFLIVQLLLIASLFIYPDHAQLFGIPFFTMSIVYTTIYIMNNRERYNNSPLSWVIVAIPTLYLIYAMWDEVIFLISIIASITEKNRKWG